LNGGVTEWRRQPGDAKLIHFHLFIVHLIARMDGNLSSEECARLQEHNGELMKLRSQLDACRQECAKLQEHNGELMKERDALRRQVDSIQKATDVTAS